MIDQDFTALRNAADVSLGGRAVHAVSEMVTAATRSSRAAKAAHAAAVSWNAIERSERTKLLLLTAGSASVFYAVLLSIEPSYVASGIPKVWYYGVGATLVLLSAASRQLTAALSDSAVARLGRWLIGKRA